MAYGGMSNDELYGDSSPEPGEPPHDEKAEAKEDQGERSATLPKSICPGMKPGDQMVLDIAQVTDDSYVVTYTPKDEPVKGEEPSEPAGAPPGEGGMSSMME